MVYATRSRFGRSRSGGRTLHVLPAGRTLVDWSVCGVHCPRIDRPRSKKNDIDPSLPVCKNCVAMLIEKKGWR